MIQLESDIECALLECLENYSPGLKDRLIKLYWCRRNTNTNCDLVVSHHMAIDPNLLPTSDWLQKLVSSLIGVLATYRYHIYGGGHGIFRRKKM